MRKLLLIGSLLVIFVFLVSCAPREETLAGEAVKKTTTGKKPAYVELNKLNTAEVITYGSGPSFGTIGVPEGAISCDTACLKKAQKTCVAAYLGKLHDASTVENPTQDPIVVWEPVSCYQEGGVEDELLKCSCY